MTDTGTNQRIVEIKDQRPVKVLLCLISLYCVLIKFDISITETIPGLQHHQRAAMRDHSGGEVRDSVHDQVRVRMPDCHQE